ncbi:MAG: hypothetical protein IT443_13515 [Phycisphaeraceae bacterium]|nr:hypothetical protein [Phycisphaeraceae bacterium]
MTSKSLDTRQAQLLMVSHCVPDAQGNAVRARAWQLLNLARGTHRVTLCCLQDDPVHFEQWQRLLALTAQVQIVRRSPWRRLLSPVLEICDPALAKRTGNVASMVPRLNQVRPAEPWDIVLCTHPALWPVAMHAQAVARLCDLHTPDSVLHYQLGRNHPRLQRWHRSQARQCQEWETDVCAQAHTALVADSRTYRQLRSLNIPSLWLPETLDLDRLPQDAPPAAKADAPQLVVVHADWSRQFLPARLDHFLRHAWPRIQSQYPSARLRVTANDSTRSALKMLRDATLVVVPTPEPELARWPILQAMAMRRPVLASAHVADNLVIRHGEQALLADTLDQWVQGGLQLLYSANLRQRLSTQSRAYVEQCWSSTADVSPWVQPLPEPLPLAAAA